MRRYIIPIVKHKAQADRMCPKCQRPSGRIHQNREQAIIDIKLGEVTKVRMRCRICAHTWTSQPDGVKAHYQRSQRVRALNVLLYALGLSYEGVAVALTALGAAQTKASVYRDLQQAGQEAKRLHQRGQRKIRVAGIDGTGQRVAEPGQAHSEGLIFVVDIVSGQLLEVQLLDENDSEAIRQLVVDLESKFGISLWISDEHTSYSGAIAPGRHRLCTAHFKKAKIKRITKLRQQSQSKKIIYDLDQLETILREAPTDGSQRAYEIYCKWRWARPPGKGKKASVSWRLKQLALDISQSWAKVWEYTNNATERAIGLCLKIRSKVMRGFKVKENILGFVHLVDWMRQSGQRVYFGFLGSLTTDLKEESIFGFYI
jgi:hypothetical protein